MHLFPVIKRISFINALAPLHCCSTLSPSILRVTLTLRLWLFNKAHTDEQWSLSLGHSSEGSEAIIWLGSIEIIGGSGGGGWSIKTSSSCSPVKRFRSKLSTGTLHQHYNYTLWTTSHPTVKLCTAVSEWVVERGISSPFDSCSRDYSDHWFSNLRKGGHMPLVPCTGSTTGASQQGWWHTTFSDLQIR